MVPPEAWAEREDNTAVAAVKACHSADLPRQCLANELMKITQQCMGQAAQLT